jgi:predicted MPP superfamily phosphohydrolase
MADHPARRLLPALLVGALSALGLSLLLLQGNLLWLPHALQPLGHVLYRGAYWLTLPAQWTVLTIAPGSNYHMPAQHEIAASIVTGVCLALAWLALARRPGRPRANEPDARRREVLARLGLGIGALGALGVGAWGCIIEPSRLKLRRYTVPIRGLPSWAEGLRLVHLSDTHYGPYVPMPHVRRAVRMANELQADLAVLTGDYVHRTLRAIPEGVGVLCELRARLGRFAVLGNHDHWADAEACWRQFRTGGVHTVDHRHLFLGPQGLQDRPSEDAICLAGFGDLWEDKQPPQVALTGVPEDMPRIVLSHNPDYAEKIPEGLRVDLMISGHTHGGQVFIPGKGTPKVPSNYGQWYAGGLCQGPRCPVVVSRGVGMAYLPVRIAVPPELVLITLTRAPEES